MITSLERGRYDCPWRVTHTFPSPILPVRAANLRGFGPSSRRDFPSYATAVPGGALPAAGPPAGGGQGVTGYKAVVDPAALGWEFEVIIHADLVAKDLATVAAFEERGTQRRHPDRRPGCLTMATYPP